MKALSAAHQTNWEHQFDDDQQWMGLWQVQREEVTARLHVQNAEKRLWNEIATTFERTKYKPSVKAPTQMPNQAISPRAPYLPQGTATYGLPFERTVELRNRIAGLPETKQILLSQFVNVRAPRAITKDATGMATIDPYQLDAAAFTDVMTHLKLLEDDASRARPQEVPGAWNTGYVGDLPPRDRTASRPNGTIGSGRAQPGSRASFTWEEMQVQPLPPKTTTPRKAFATSIQAAPPEQTPRLTTEERAEREALANRIATLPEPHQRTISQEVRLFCPQAIFQATPGYATINTSELDRRTFNRVKELVEELFELGKQDENAERERSIRRQVEREQFLARERARERERALDVEIERRAREEQIKEELERDLDRIRSEVETERRSRWQKEGEERRKLLLERSTPRQAEQVQTPAAGPTEEDSVRPLRRKLAEILRELTDENMFAFADYALQLQPEAVDSQNNSIHPNRFDKVSLPLAVNYACQLKANQRPTYRLTAPPDTQQGGRVLETPRTETGPKATPRTADAIPPPGEPQVLPSDVEVALTPEQLKEREQLSQSIVRLGRTQQRAVCDWLRANAPHAIKVLDGSTSIETAVLSEGEYVRLHDFIRAQSADGI